MTVLFKRLTDVGASVDLQHHGQKQYQKGDYNAAIQTFTEVGDFFPRIEYMDFSKTLAAGIERKKCRYNRHSRQPSRDLQQVGAV